MIGSQLMRQVSESGVTAIQLISVVIDGAEQSVQNRISRVTDTDHR